MHGRQIDIPRRFYRIFHRSDGGARAVGQGAVQVPDDVGDVPLVPRLPGLEHPDPGVGEGEAGDGGGGPVEVAVVVVPGDGRGRPPVVALEVEEVHVLQVGGALRADLDAVQGAAGVPWWWGRMGFFY